MDRLTDQMDQAFKAYATLRAVDLAGEPHQDVRDIAILRFIYTFETVWKAARLFLGRVHGVVANTPKPVVRGCFEAGLLSDDETTLALAMVDDRNLAVHTYREVLAEELLSRLAGHRDLMGLWLDRMRSALGGPA